MSSPRQQLRSPARAVETKSAVTSAARAVERSALSAARSARPGSVAKITGRSHAGEREAERVARHVTDPVTTTVAASSLGQPSAARTIATGGGQPLPANVRTSMEARFGTSFAGVRIHADARAARLAASLGAQAFTRGHEIFFAPGAYDPASEVGRRTIAHELTHTIQQGAVPRPQRIGTGPQAIVERAEGSIQRLSLSDAIPTLEAVRDHVAEQANAVPGFRAFSLVLGRNPISGRTSARTPAEFLRAILELVPGGAVIVLALDRYGIIDSAGAWLTEQLTQLRALGLTVEAAIRGFLSGIELSDLLDLSALWERGRQLIADLIGRVAEVVRPAVAGLLRILREAILDPLAVRARSFRGYDLLSAILGHEPLTGQPVPRTAETLLGGALKLIGQNEVWENMRRANAIERAFAWFRNAVEALTAFASEVPGLVRAMIERLTPHDLLNLPGLVGTVTGLFGNLASRFTTWASNALWTLLELLVDSISPGALGYIRRTGSALRSILENPLPFMRNLLRAAKEGFERFATNLPAHLRAGLIGWLTGTLPGVHIPSALTYAEVVRFILSVLNLSWAAVRTKLVTAVGEPTVNALERGFDVVQVLVREGPAAAWERIREQLSELRETLFDGIQSFVVETVMARAIPRLIAMFVPGAGFITAVLSIYDTVMVIVDRLARIVQMVRGFVDSITAIAAGSIGAATQRVESALASALTLAIEVFAGFVGLRRVGERVRAIIERLRAPVDRALTAVVRWLVQRARAFIAAMKRRARQALAALFPRRRIPMADGSVHTMYAVTEPVPRIMMASTPMAVKDFLDRWFAGQSQAFRDSKAAAKAELEAEVAVAEAILARQEVPPAGQAASPDDSNELLNQNAKITRLLMSLLGRTGRFADIQAKYALEGLTGTYRSLRGPTGDRLTPDHQPQASIFLHLKDLDTGNSKPRLRDLTAGRHVDGGYCINLHEQRHRLGRTYGMQASDFIRAVSGLGPNPLVNNPSGIVSLLQDELRQDAHAILSVIAPNSPQSARAWEDITALQLQQTEEESLKQSIKNRIIAGEAEMSRQGFASLFGP
jgi:hypothetical protein